MTTRTIRKLGVRAARKRQAVLQRRWRIAVFTAAAAVVLGIAVFLVVSPLRTLWTPAPAVQIPTGETQRLFVTMAGFEPQALRVPALQPFTVHLINPDSPYHSDGGGWHQFRIESLGVDVRVPPRSERRQTVAGLAPGTYEFYCDVCCGGKENPSMRGVIEVVG